MVNCNSRRAFLGYSWFSVLNFYILYHLACIRALDFLVVFPQDFHIFFSVMFLGMRFSVSNKVSPFRERCGALCPYGKPFPSVEPLCHYTGGWGWELTFPTVTPAFWIRGIGIPSLLDLLLLAWNFYLMSKLGW